MLVSRVAGGVRWCSEGSKAVKHAVRAVGPVEFKSADGSRVNDEAFLRLLAMSAAGPASGTGAAAGPGGQQLARLPLDENDVAKVHNHLHNTSSISCVQREAKIWQMGIWLYHSCQALSGDKQHGQTVVMKP